MVFYIYVDPEIIIKAKERGQDSLQNLIAILRDFVDNCFLTEFEDYRVQDAIEQNVEEIPEGIFERKQIKTLLSILQKRNRFIYCMKPDYSGQKSDVDIVLENATGLLIDLLLIGTFDNEIDYPQGIEITDLSNYQNTQFAETRSEIMRDGRDYVGGELDEQAFLDLNYKKAFMYVRRLEICDRIFGGRFGANFEYSTKILLRWLAQILVNPVEFKIVFHCEKPQGHTEAHIKNRLSHFKQGRLENTQIEIIFYETLDGSHCLPHDRYFVTDQIAFQIGRGMDFLDRNTHKNKDTSIEIKNPSMIEKKIEHYKDNKLPSIFI